jgi:hypothetical protein
MSRRPRQKAINGEVVGPSLLEVLSVKSAADQFTGGSQGQIRSRVNKRQIPFHRWGGRLVFLKSELLAFFAALEGTSVTEALENERRRRETQE